MYSRGLSSFISYKNLNSKQAIDSFLISEGITEFTHKNHNIVNNYIDKNWSKFASFVDKGLKSGSLRGKAIKLNSYFDEQRKYREAVKTEMADLLPLERKGVEFVKTNGTGKLQSFIQKKGYNPPAKDYSFTSKNVQYLPLIQLAIEQGFEF